MTAEVWLFTAHGELEGKVSSRVARRMVRDGDAHEVWAGRRAKRMLVGIRRALGQVIVRSSPTPLACFVLTARDAARAIQLAATSTT